MNRRVRNERLLSGAAWGTMAAFFILLWGGCERIEQWKIGRSSQPSQAIFASPELVYQTASTELQISQTGKPYLTFDIPANSIEIRLGGAILQTIPLALVEVDSSALPKFIESFANGRGLLVRPVTGKYLFGAKEQTPDSILTIVGNVVNVKPELLQREIPSRFRLFWGEKLIMDVVSDVEAAPPGELRASLQERLNNAMIEARHVMRRPFGARQIVIKAKPDEAMTLYRVAEAGTPTLLQLVNTDLPIMEKTKNGR